MGIHPRWQVSRYLSDLKIGGQHDQSAHRRCRLVSRFDLPATFLLMLFLGDLGKHLSYWGTFPLGILVSALIGASGSVSDARST